MLISSRTRSGWIWAHEVYTTLRSTSSLFRKYNSILHVFPVFLRRLQIHAVSRLVIACIPRNLGKSVIRTSIVVTRNIVTRCESFHTPPYYFLFQQMQNEPDAEDAGNSGVFRGVRFYGACCSLRLLRLLSVDILGAFEAYQGASNIDSGYLYGVCEENNTKKMLKDGVDSVKLL